MGKLIAVQGMTLSDTLGGAPVITINTSPSIKVKAENKGIYSGGISITVASGSVSSKGCTLTSAAIGTISPTALKVKENGQLVNRQDDEVSISGPGLTGGGSGCTATFNIKITNAGQTKVKAE
jgi:hypothetical protein